MNTIIWTEADPDPRIENVSDGVFAAKVDSTNLPGRWTGCLVGTSPDTHAIQATSKPAWAFVAKAIPAAPE